MAAQLLQPDNLPRRNAGLSCLGGRGMRGRRGALACSPGGTRLRSRWCCWLQWLCAAGLLVGGAHAQQQQQGPGSSYEAPQRVEGALADTAIVPPRHGVDEGQATAFAAGATLRFPAPGASTASELVGPAVALEYDTLPWLYDQANAPGLRMEAFKLGSDTAHDPPDLAQLAPDLITYAALPDWPTSEGVAWPELNAFNVSMQPAFARFDGAAYFSRFAVRLTSRLLVPRDSTYTFYLGADDSARLFIDGALVLERIRRKGDGGYATEWAHARLRQGEREMRLEYFQDGGAMGLTLQYSRPGVPKAVLGAGGELLLPLADGCCAARCGPYPCAGGDAKGSVVCWGLPGHAPRLPPTPTSCSGPCDLSTVDTASVHMHNPHPYVVPPTEGFAGFHVPTNLTRYFDVFDREWS